MYMIQDVKGLLLLTTIILILLMAAMGFAHSLKKKAVTSEQLFKQLSTDNDGPVSRGKNEKNK